MAWYEMAFSYESAKSVEIVLSMAWGQSSHRKVEKAVVLDGLNGYDGLKLLAI